MILRIKKYTNYKIRGKNKLLTHIYLYPFKEMTKGLAKKDFTFTPFKKNEIHFYSCKLI